MVNMKTKYDWESLGFYVMPNAPIAGYNRYGTPMHTSDWVRVDDDMPW